MPFYKFEDWAGRVYDDPAVGTVEPGDVRELDSAPDDGHWTVVDGPVEVSTNVDNDEVSTNVDKPEDPDTNTESANPDTDTKTDDVPESGQDEVTKPAADTRDENVTT